MESNALTLLVLPLVLLVVGSVAGFVVGWVLGQRKGAQSDDGMAGRLESLTQSNQRLATEHAAAVETARLQTSRVEELEDRAAQDQDLLRALAPLTDRMRQMQDHVTRLERDRSEQFGDVSRALAAARESDVKLQQVTGALEGSLRSNSARGVWGEMQLRRVVEAAGMLRHVDFTEQVTVASEQTQVRPDMVVHLPGDQQIVVDAKAPLSAYLEAQDISDPSASGARRRSEQLALHAKAVRAHVDALGKKKYWDTLPGSPDLVLCFIPVESALAVALDTDPTLLDHAASRNIALVSPVSLLASLKAVAFSWRQESLAQDATELLRLSRELYDRLGTMGGHLSKMGGSIRRSVEQYNQLVGSLERRVLPTARKLNDLGPTAADDERLVTSAVEIQPQALTAPELLRDLPES